MNAELPMIAVARVVVVALGAALAGCAGIPVHTDYDASIGIAHCRSFAWPKPSTNEDAFGNPLNLKRVRAAVSTQLRAHGLTETDDPAQADCVAAASIGTRNEAGDDPGPWGPTGWSGWASWGSPWGPGWGGGWGFSDQYFHRQGSIAVNLFDARTHEPIWHASAQRDVSALTGDAAQHAIDEAVLALFARFPAAGAGT